MSEPGCCQDRIDALSEIIRDLMGDCDQLRAEKDELLLQIVALKSTLDRICHPQTQSTHA